MITIVCLAGAAACLFASGSTAREVALRPTVVCGSSVRGVVSVQPGRTLKCLVAMGDDTGAFARIERARIELIGSDGSRRTLRTTRGLENTLNVVIRFGSANAGKRYVLRATLTAHGITRTLDRAISVGPRSRTVTVFDRKAVGVGVTIEANGSVQRPFEMFMGVVTTPAQPVDVHVETVCVAAGRRARSVIDRGPSPDDAGVVVVKLRLPFASPDSCSVNARITSVGAKKTELSVDVLARAA
jgi:hypothetical protein